MRQPVPRPLWGHVLAWAALVCLTTTTSTSARAERYFWLDEAFDHDALDPTLVSSRAVGEGTVLVVGDGSEGLPTGATELNVRDGASVHLIELRDARDEAALDTDGVAVLRRAGPLAVVALDPAVLPTYRGSLGERLRHLPRARTAPLRPARGKVDPDVKADIVDDVDEAHYLELVEELSGARSFTLDGQTITNNDRYTFRPGHYVAADYLQERLEALGYTVVRQEFTVSSTPTQNVVAIKTGMSTPEEIVVVGGHYDSISYRDDINGPAPGAEDNGSGTAGVLHLAEILAPYDTQRSVHFVAFGAEEQGLYGSEHYVAEAVNRGDTIVAALTMDMISAYTTNYRIDIEGTTSPPLTELMNLYDANVTEFAPGLDTVQKFDSFGSDHVPFQRAGIPAFLAIESDYNSYPAYHYTTDTAEKLTPSLGRDVLRAMAASLADLTDPKLPIDVAMPVSGLAAAWVQGGVEVQWQVHDVDSVAGFVVWRRLGARPSTPLFEEPLPAEAGVMRWVDREVEAEPLRVYHLEAVSPAGERWFLPGSIQASAPPRAFWLAQNVPNPFNPRTSIAFSIATAGPVHLDVHDAAGRRVRRLVDGELPPGPYQVTWDGSDEQGRAVASGVYYYRLLHDDSIRIRRMMLVR